MDNPLFVDIVKANLKINKLIILQLFVEVKDIMYKKFLSTCIDADNVDNDTQTFQQNYQDIKKLMNLSCVGWNNLKEKLVL